MGLIRRTRHRGHPGSTSSPGAAIADFWDWWSSARAEVEHAVEAGTVETVVPPISERVAAIDPGLHWELAAGRTAEHALIVSAGGERRLRALAERWKRSSPGVDAGWEFHSSRQPDPGALGNNTLTLAEFEFDLAEVVLGLQVDDERAVVDVSVHHPLFPLVPEQNRTTVTFLVLDWLLGEDGVERWIGGVEVAEHRPLDAVAATALPSVVAQVAERHREPRWAVLSGEARDGLPVVATVRLPLKPVEFPLFDLHVGVGVPYSHANPGRLPVDPSLAALCDLEDTLVDRLGGSALFVGHESHRGVRLLHFYADSQDNVPAQIEAVCRSWSDGRVRVDAHLDGGWEQIGHLRI